MSSPPADLVARLREHSQDHVLRYWGRLDADQRRQLVADLERVDLAELCTLYERRDQKAVVPAADRIAPLPRPSHDAARLAAHGRRGEEAFRGGEVAFLLVAGGQGTRLDFHRAKGAFPVGPVSHKSLFQIHAEKVLALRRRFGRDFPLLVMTSPATDAETRTFFAEHGHFGLPPDAVWFFCQGTMPALDLATGRLLLEAPGRLFVSPDGHGGCLTALAKSGLLARLDAGGFRTVYFFQVDNPLVDLADAGFLGQHLALDAEVSSKVVPKASPNEKVGNFVLVDGRCTMIEYSDLDESLARATDEQGRPRLWAGNPAIHLFDVGFLGRVMHRADGLPWHVARKIVPHVNDEGEPVKPTQPNALKFERFIFDILPQAERWAVFETTRAKEFAPLKNKDGADSPATVRQALIDQAAAWLAHAGVTAGQHPVEISPLYALDADELAAKVPPGLTIDGPTYLTP
jgi:UDP-N-acetylglucosamine/UDP-N-acetylgalactosamine diphosphorylase